MVKTSYLDAYLEHIADPPILREACAQAAYWKNCTIQVSPREPITGLIVLDEPVMFNYARGTHIRWEIVQQLKKDGRDRKSVV